MLVNLLSSYITDCRNAVLAFVFTNLIVWCGGVPGASMLHPALALALHHKRLYLAALTPVAPRARPSQSIF